MVKLNECTASAAMILCMSCVAGSVAAKAPETKKKPNILLVISDDQCWCHTGIGGDKVVKTPAFDEIAENGVLFNYAFCAAPSSTASRASLLTGQNIWRLDGGAQLHGPLPKEHETYSEILEANGYFVGHSHKGWGPGDFKKGGREQNPAGGKGYPNLEEFLKHVPEGSPWCFWYGSYNPHRSYKKDIGINSGIRTDCTEVPGFLPDETLVRNDMADYYHQIQVFDGELKQTIDALKKNGEFNNTFIAVAGDNGMPFPRAKATLYDYGVRIPLAVCWGDHMKKGRVVDDFVSLMDLAPTFLEVAGVKVPDEMTGRSIMNIVKSKKSGDVDKRRSFITSARERHASSCRKGALGYPARMIRTKDYLYIRNYQSERWPAGDPEKYGDVDNSPSKSLLIDNKDVPKYSKYFELAFGKRPQEELYDCRKDPFQLDNLAEKEEYSAVKEKMSKMLTDYLIETGDPRETGQKIIWQ